MHHFAAVPALIVFTKNPVRGRVKTRLAAQTNDLFALMVNGLLARHTLRVASQWPFEKRILYSDYVPRGDAWQKAGFAPELQCGATLGERLANAWQGACVVIGTDCPGLRAEHLRAAAAALSAGDAVLGPCRDGGYYLLGLRRPHPSVFEVDWSTERVLAQTRERFQTLGWRYASLETLWDVDDLQALQ